VRKLAAVLWIVSLSLGCGGGGGTPATSNQVQSVSPSNEAKAVAPGSKIVATMGAAVEPASVTAASFFLSLGSALVPAALSISSDGTQLTLAPSAALAAGATYTATLTTAIAFASGEALKANYTWSFMTAASTMPAAPTVVSTTPGASATGVAQAAAITATFSRAMAPATLTTSSFTLKKGGATASLCTSVTYSGLVATCVTSAPLDLNSGYAAAITAAAKDPGGIAVTAKSWSFTTAPAPADTTPPTVVSTIPDNAATGAPVSSLVVVTLSEPISSSSGSAFSLSAHGGAAVAGTASVNGAVLTFTPAASLAYGAAYDATLATTLKDLAGNPLAAAYAFSFTTGTAPAIAIDEISAKVASGTAGDANGDGATSSSQDEFLELLNTDTAKAADLSGLKVKSGTSTKFTFPTGTALPAGARLVIFGGGVPTGSFGSAQTFIASLSLTDSGGTLSLVRPDGSISDTATYGASAASGASWVRQPEGTGNFVAHDTVTGNAGILWSPGVAATAAIPKVNLSKSTPAAGATGVASNAVITVQFNMAMTGADLTNANLQLFQSDCTTAVPATATALGASQATITPSAALASSTPYCVAIAQAVRSHAGTALAAPVTWSFTTGTTQFNLISATATSQTSLQLVFSSPPDATQAADPANFCLAMGAATSCAQPGDLAVSAATLTDNTVTLTTAAQPAGKSFTAFSTVTRAADAAHLTTASAPFTTWTTPAFNLLSAIPTSPTTLELAYSDAYLAGAAAENPASYCIALASAADCSTPALTATTAVATGPQKIVVTTAANQDPGVAYRIYATGVLRSSDSAPLTQASANFAGWLLPNASFEADTASPPSGWTVITSGAFAALATGNTPPPHQGANVAKFASLTSSISGREAHSSCFPVLPGPLTFKGSLRTPTAVGNTKASFKVYWFTDATCATAASTASNAQTAFSLSTPETWQQSSFSAAAPANATHAYVSLRAQYASPGTSAELLYFDDLSVTQP
jgi:hypothetical protein